MTRAIMAALRPIPKPYHYKQLFTYNYGHAGLCYMTSEAQGILAK